MAGGGRLAVEVVVDRVDRLRADLVGMLDRVAVHRAVADRGARFGVRVVADDDDLALLPGRRNRLDRPERRVVVDPEDALEPLCDCMMSSIDE